MRLLSIFLATRDALTGQVKRLFGFAKAKIKPLQQTGTQLVVHRDPEEWNKVKQGAQALVLAAGSNALVTLDKSIHFISSSKDSKTDNEVLNTARGPLVFGVWVVIILVGFFGLWAVLAPLDSAAVAHGTVVVDTNRKTIQHLEGGIIEEILVKDGQKVQAGQALMRLDDTTAKARLDLIQGQLFSARAAEARLVAERDESDAVVLSDEIRKEAKRPELAKILDSQLRLFDARRVATKGQIDVLNQQISQLDDEITGLAAQVDSSTNQLAFIEEEIAVVKKLLEKGNANKPRLLALQRQGALLAGNKGEYQARIAQARQEIGRAKLEISNIRSKFLNDVVTELKETQVNIADLEERKRAAKDVLDRTVISASEEGVVTDLQFHTIGGVISAGAKIMDIVPQDEKLTVEARISLQDIDVVHAGLRARVRLTAYKRRETPILEGVVEQVSADKLFDNITRESYYKARVVMDEDMMRHLTNKNIQLYPGMPVDVLIVTGTRTFMAYLISPITDTFVKAFREQ